CNVNFLKIPNMYYDCTFKISKKIACYGISFSKKLSLFYYIVNNRINTFLSTFIYKANNYLINISLIQKNRDIIIYVSDGLILFFVYCITFLLMLIYRLLILIYLIKYQKSL